MARNIGDKDDIWQAGQILGPNFDNLTYPNTDSYQWGEVEITGIIIEVLESQGLNVRVRVTFPDGWGEGAPPKEQPVFSAPQREENYNTLAEDQFKVPDDPDARISGMIPQLPWFEKWQQQEASKAEQQENSAVELATEETAGVETSTIFTSSVLSNASDTLLSSSSSRQYRSCCSTVLVVLLAVLPCWIG